MTDIIATPSPMGSATFLAALLGLAKKLSSLRNGALTLLAVATGFGGFAYRDQIADSASGLAKQLTRVSLWGVELEFSGKAIDKAVPTQVFQFVSDERKGRIATTINTLGDEEIVRLLNVGLLERLCDFELGTMQMRLDFEMDLRLRDKGLVTIQDDRQGLMSIARARRVGKTGAGLDIGAPRFCYRMALTDDGRDVRTALTFSYAAKFPKAVAGGKPTAPPPASPAIGQQASR